MKAYTWHDVKEASVFQYRTWLVEGVTFLIGASTVHQINCMLKKRALNRPPSTELTRVVGRCTLRGGTGRQCECLGDPVAGEQGKKERVHFVWCVHKGGCIRAMATQESPRVTTS